MSELTTCNFCDLEAMKRRAQSRGVTVVVERHTHGEWAGWTSARYSDEERPIAWFLELSDRCVC